MNKDFPAQLLKKARGGGRGRGKKRQNLVRKHRNTAVQFNGLKALHVCASRIFPSLSSEVCQDSLQWLQWDKAISGFTALSFNTDVTANSCLHGNLLGTAVSFPTPGTGLCKPPVSTHRQTRCFPASKEMEAEHASPLSPFPQVPHFHVLSPFHLKDRERRGSSGSGLHADGRKATRNHSKQQATRSRTDSLRGSRAGAAPFNSAGRLCLVPASQPCWCGHRRVTGTEMRPWGPAQPRAVPSLTAARCPDAPPPPSGQHRGAGRLRCAAARSGSDGRCPSEPGCHPTRPRLKKPALELRQPSTSSVSPHTCPRSSFSQGEGQTDGCLSAVRLPLRDGTRSPTGALCVAPRTAQCWNQDLEGSRAVPRGCAQPALVAMAQGSRGTSVSPCTPMLRPCHAPTSTQPGLQPPRWRWAPLPW